MSVGGGWRREGGGRGARGKAGGIIHEGGAGTPSLRPHSSPPPIHHTITPSHHHTIHHTITLSHHPPTTNRQPHAHRGQHLPPTTCHMYVMVSTCHQPPSTCMPPTADTNHQPQTPTINRQPHACHQQQTPATLVQAVANSSVSFMCEGRALKSLPFDLLTPAAGQEPGRRPFHGPATYLVSHAWVSLSHGPATYLVSHAWVSLSHAHTISHA